MSPRLNEATEQKVKNKTKQRPKMDITKYRNIKNIANVVNVCCLLKDTQMTQKTKMKYIAKVTFKELTYDFITHVIPCIFFFLLFLIILYINTSKSQITVH